MSCRPSPRRIGLFPASAAKRSALLCLLAREGHALVGVQVLAHMEGAAQLRDGRHGGHVHAMRADLYVGHAGALEHCSDRVYAGAIGREALAELRRRQIAPVLPAARRGDLRHQRFQSGGIVQRQMHCNRRRTVGRRGAYHGCALYPGRHVGRSRRRGIRHGRTGDGGGQQAAPYQSSLGLVKHEISPFINWTLRTTVPGHRSPRRLRGVLALSFHVRVIPQDLRHTIRNSA